MKINGSKCSGCGRRFVGAGACPSCGRREGLAELPLSGQGRVYSFTEVHIPTPRHAERAPYVLALIDLQEGVRVTAQVETDRPEAIAIDLPVAFSRQEEGVLFFRPER